MPTATSTDTSPKFSNANVTTYGVHDRTNVIAVMEGHDVKQLENLHRFLLEQEDVLAVFPTFVTSDEDDG